MVVGWLYIRTAWRFLSQPKCLGEKLRNSERLFYIRTQLLEPNQVTIRIANNGLGIREDAFKQIFNPFFTTKPVGRGTGMGLAISHQIITQRHGGSLECILQPGVGAEFIRRIQNSGVRIQN
ncbi:sensor histidine kinase [uncultured Nostoc sp.]|uniref:sensor histidine kinase n=1 Tax=uncultured Nostoc sp. TaxID=340711 RepID=UPI0035C9D797